MNVRGLLILAGLLVIAVLLAISLGLPRTSDPAGPPPVSDGVAVGDGVQGAAEEKGDSEQLETALAILVVQVVKGSDGRPLAHIQVRVYQDPLTGKPRSDSDMTDGSGRVTFEELGAGEVSIAFKSDDWVEKAPYQSLRLKPGERREVTLKAFPPGRIEGRIVNSEGQLVIGAQVYCAVGEWSDWDETMSGSFRFGGLWPGTYALRGRRCEVIGPAATVSVVPGETVGVDVLFPADSWIDIRVTDEATGKPVHGVSVPFRYGETHSTGSDGRVRLGPLPAGSYSLAFRHALYRPAGRKVELAPATTESLEVVLKRGLEIRGRVVLPDGRPSRSGSVDWDGEYRRPNEGPGGSRQTGIARDGTFRLTGLPEGELLIVATWREAAEKRHRSKSYIRSKSEGVTIVLEPVPEKKPGPVLEFRVLDGDGRPVPRGEYDVLARKTDGSRAWDKAEEFRDGRVAVELRGTEADVLISIEAARAEDGTALPLGSVRLGPIPAVAGCRMVHLPPERIIAGVIQGPDGTGMAGIEISAYRTYLSGEGGVTNSLWNARTDEKGAFLIGGLGDETYRFLADPPVGLCQADALPIPAGTLDAVIRLDVEVEVTITVLDPEGRPVPGALVQVAGPYEDSGKTDAAGAAWLQNLCKSGPHTVTITPPRDDLEKVVLERWTPNDETVHLPAAR